MKLTSWTLSNSFHGRFAAAVSIKDMVKIDDKFWISSQVKMIRKEKNYTTPTDRSIGV